MRTCKLGLYFGDGLFCFCVLATVACMGQVFFMLSEDELGLEERLWVLIENFTWCKWIPEGNCVYFHSHTDT